MTTLPSPAMPRLDTVRALPDARLHLVWEDGSSHTLSLLGLIHYNAFCAPLQDPDYFARAYLEENRCAVEWPSRDDDPDNTIDLGADQLATIAREQTPFTNADFRAWQERVKLSNQEAADSLDISLGSVKLYRGEREIPRPIAMACRLLESDPNIFVAHFRPRIPGRPRKAGQAAE